MKSLCSVPLLSGLKDINADHAASHLGQCQGLVTVLRGTTFHSKRNKVYIPQDLLLKVTAPISILQVLLTYW